MVFPSAPRGFPRRNPAQPRVSGFGSLEDAWLKRQGRDAGILDGNMSTIPLDYRT